MVGRALLGHSQVVALVYRVDYRVLLGHCPVVSRVFISSVSEVNARVLLDATT